MFFFGLFQWNVNKLCCERYCRNERLHRVLRAAVTSCGQHSACGVVSSTYWYVSVITSALNHTPQTQPFYGPFPGPPGWAGARRELLDFMVQGEINRGRHTDHPGGRHSIRTNQCQPPPSPIFLRAGCPSCRPTISVKALKVCQYPHVTTTTSAFGLWRRR